MQKILFLAFVSCCFSLKVHAQVNPEEKTVILDSAALLADLMNLMDSANKPYSYTIISVAAGNRLFSLNNNRLNAKQETSNTMVYNPSVGYYHKSGLSLSAGASLLKNVQNGFGVNQYSITPAYDLIGDSSFNVGISYTHNFVKDKFSSYSSPIQDDWYAAVSYKKTWLEPGIAFGYSTGEYKQLKTKDTVINNIKRTYYDSATFALKSFSLMLSASHNFGWEQVFSKKDEISFTPSVMLNMGSSTTNITHKTNAQALINFLNKRGKLPRLLSNSFQAESLGLNLDATYTINNFSIEPQLYFDYYLPKSDSNKFSQIFTVTVSYTF